MKVGSMKNKKMKIGPLVLTCMKQLMIGRSDSLCDFTAILEFFK